MRSGQYRHFGSIEQEVVTGTGDRGQPIRSWTTLYSAVPMSINALHGEGLQIAKQLVATATHKIGLRWLAGLTAITTRINFGGRLFLVGFVDETDFRKRYVYLTVTEQQSGG